MKLIQAEKGSQLYSMKKKMFQLRWSRKKSKNTLFCHSGKSRNPVNSMASGCRIKSGMTVLGLFTSLSIKLHPFRTMEEAIQWLGQS
ncbi:MAG: hypothetical protein U9N83_16465 [Thermodesulfobacteriota bacterium]|nr:hypothetical protein [Thermodesulfobacteriota bacterium]